MVSASQYHPAVPGSSPASSTVAEFVFRTSRAQIPGPMTLNTPILLLLFVCLFVFWPLLFLLLTCLNSGIYFFSFFVVVSNYYKGRACKLN